MSDRRFVCGCYVIHSYHVRKYLPQLALKTHVTVQATAYTAVLSQTFVNPLAHDSIEKLRYTFPLFDGVSVVDFECRIGQRVIKGLVKERQEAKATYEAAVQRGETAGLLEQLPDASDVFTTTLGNIPPKETIHVTIRYVGELKHDAEIDGLRFTLPTAIAPRYGTPSHELLADPGVTPNLAQSGMEITVDVDMADSLPIQKITSPSHPISVSIGTLSGSPDADASLSRGSATLALQQASLDNDFVLQILAKGLGNPLALLETHPTLPNQRALMATFVPKFALQPARPEIIFIADRSGSMAGNIPLLVSAMRVFLKSLPPGVRFNICSFGSHASLLWSKSQKYDANTMNEALQHIEKFRADFGGTETLKAVETAVKSRYGDLPTELMLLTDGDIWNQNSLFDYLNDQVSKSKGDIRLFTLGIGGGVSHALIEGAARAGNGFSQAVGDGERLDGKVVRMLKGALSPHINDYTFEVTYGGDADDDFEMIDRASDIPKIDVAPVKSAEPKVISLFDPDSKSDETKEEPPKNKYDHLPPVESPSVLQAPSRIPSLFPFSRTTVFLLLAPSSKNRIPERVTFRGSSPQGPVELSIPVAAAQPGATIHQLAARKAVLDLEEGRGWLLNAKNSEGKLLKTASPSIYEDLVECAAVRIGTRFQVASKWCSFVAVEDKKETVDVDPPEYEPEGEFEGMAFDGAMPVSRSSYSAPPPPGGLPRESRRRSAAGGGFFGGAQPTPPPPPAPLAAPAAFCVSKPIAAPSFASKALSTLSFGSAGRDRAPDASKEKRKKSSRGGPPSASFASAMCDEASGAGSSQAQGSLLDRIIAAQEFDGSWKLGQVPWADMAVDTDRVKRLGDDAHRNDLLVTAAVVLYLEESMAEERATWELVVDKARDWIEGLKSLERRQEDVDIWQVARLIVFGA